MRRSRKVGASEEQPQMKPYVDLVIRLWLVSPTESVVESIGSIVQ